MPPRPKVKAAAEVDRRRQDEERAELQRRIVDGKVIAKRREQEEAEAEEERLQKEKAEFGPTDEEENPPASLGYIIANLCASVIFISFPLSEPDIDWLGVVVMAVVNIVWNMFFHAVTWVHYATFFMLNIVMVQHFHRFANIIMGILSLGPNRLIFFGIVNTLWFTLGYFLYIRKAPSHRIGRAWDILIMSALLVNFVIFIIQGTVSMNEFKLIVRGVLGMVMNLPQQQQQERRNTFSSPGMGGDDDDPTRNFPGAQQQQGHEQPQQPGAFPGAGGPGGPPGGGFPGGAGGPPPGGFPGGAPPGGGGMPEGVDVEFF